MIDRNSKRTYLIAEIGWNFLGDLKLAKEMNIDSKVVSMPCQELFDQQSSSFKNEIIDKNIPVITIEASCVYSWEKYSNYNMGINTFGESAPYKEVYSHFNLTSTNVVEFAKKIIKE